MNMSFWSHCQGLVRRLQQGHAVTRRSLQPWSLRLESLEARTLLSSTPAMVADINPGSGSPDIANLMAIGSTTYFTSYDSIHGRELWKSDGTAAGTVMVSDVDPGSHGSYPGSLTNVNGTLFFTAYGADGNELWKSDGTAAGTVLVSDLNPGSFGSYPGSLTNVNGTLYFSASDGDFGDAGAHGRELWKSDGTTAGTTMVKDIFPGGFTGYYGGNYANSSSPGSLTNLNGTLFFTANDGVHGYTMWKSDGTEAGTVAVGFSASGPLTNVNGTLFFSAFDWTNGTELWKSDGTAAGTTLVKDIFPGVTKQYYGYYGGYSLIPNSSNPAALTVVNGTLFFTATDGTHGKELWKSDGTDAGTVMVADITSGSLSYGTGLTEVNGTLYFSASDGVHGYELWKSDGTAAGTAMVKDIKVDTRPGVNGSYPANFTNANGTLYFTATDDTHGYELWKSDGTAAGTTLVQDIFPGGYTSNYGVFHPNSSSPANLTSANGKLLFTANDGIHGTELWALNTVPAPSLDVLGFPVTITAGSAGSFTVTARNADDTTNTGYTGTVHFASGDPQAVLPADYTFTAADHGTHVFTANLKTAGYQSITATDTQAPGNAGADWNILVKAATASAMTVSDFPSTTTAGAAQNFAVTLKDQYGNIATGYTGTVHFTSSDTKAVLPANYTFTAADAGKHTFIATLKTAGTRSITAADTLKSALTAAEGGITVTAGAASKFLISAPSTVKHDVPFSLTVTVQDAYGNVVTDYTGTVRFTSTDRKDVLPANYTFKAADMGVRTFSLVLRNRGKEKITITDTQNGTLTASVTVTGK